MEEERPRCNLCGCYLSCVAFTTEYDSEGLECTCNNKKCKARKHITDY